jgi:prevent-host-death family protein
MSQVTIRELRNNGAEVLARLAAGESVMVTRDGRPVAELRPLPRQPLTTRGIINTNIVVLLGRLGPEHLPDEPVITADSRLR